MRGLPHFQEFRSGLRIAVGQNAVSEEFSRKPNAVREEQRHYRPTMYALITLAVTGNISALVYFKWYRPKAQREERERGEQVEEYPSLFK
jgi:hypothetical protein